MTEDQRNELKALADRLKTLWQKYPDPIPKPTINDVMKTKWEIFDIYSDLENILFQDELKCQSTNTITKS